MSQRKYVLDILQDTGLTSVRPDKFPMEKYLKLTPDNGELSKDLVKYRRLVGRLIYLTVTQSDSVFGLESKSIYIGSMETLLGCRNSSPEVPQRITGTRIVIAIREQSNIDSLL